MTKKAKKKGKKKAAKRTTKRSMSKSQLLTVIAEEQELTKKQVGAVFDQLRDIIVAEVNPKSRTAPGVFTIPGIARIKTRKKPARKARKGTNPFTGEEMMFKAKPASIVLKLLPIKAMKEAVN